MKYLFFILLIYGCTAPHAQEDNVEKHIKVPDGIKHNLFDNYIAMYLPEKYERYNLKELHAILKSENGNPLIKRLFNETIIRFYASTDHKAYVFMDTTSYEHYMILSELPARASPVRKEYSSQIAKQLKNRASMLLGIDKTELRTKTAEFGSQNRYEHVYVKIKNRDLNNTICSEHFAISHKNKSYILDALSTFDTDLEFIKNNITFQ